jgi:two-component system cell cycle sensor histidine kinase/response regulator CckA
MTQKKHSILIVEDEGLVAQDLQMTLEEFGYDAFGIASSAEEAIRAASNRCPDLVLMDIRIKGNRDGIETAELLKQRFEVPVVYLTAHADDATIERAKKTSPHGYLLKPVRTAELKSAIEISIYKNKMEKRLRESEQWFSSTLRSIADAVITVDLSGQVTFMNAAAEALTGLQAESVIGKTYGDVLKLFVSSADEPLARALHENRSIELREARLENVSTGAQYIISDSAAPVISRGETLGAVMVFRDVTEQKQMQKKLELVDRLSSLGTMAAGVAHEINNPLAAVNGNVDFVLSELTQLKAELDAGSIKEAKARLDEIFVSMSDTKSASNRVARIVSDLRLFSRPAEQKTSLVNVNKCVEWVLRATSQEFQFRARVATQLGEVLGVEVDESKLGQVLVNLLVNAAHSISPGKVEQNVVRVSTFMDKKGRASIEIKDTGSGMSPELIKKIFEPFFTTKDVGEGTGLGLSICHGIIASFGGEIEVESEVGNGSTFRVCLPAARTSEKTKAPDTLPKTYSKSGRILLIDDEVMILKVLGRILRGYEVVSVENGQEALALIDKGEKFDIAFSDLIMPKITGSEFYEALLTRDPDLAQNVVFLTGGSLTIEMDAFLNSIPNLIVEKPFSKEQIIAVVQEVLEKKAALSNR